MPRLTIWFDGGCPPCRREIAFIQRLDRGRAIDFIDVSDGNANCPVDRAAMLARFHAREDGEMMSGAAAFAAMWRAVPLLRPLGLAARNRHVLAWLERIYLRYLRIRPRLQAMFRR